MSNVIMFPIRYSVVGNHNDIPDSWAVYRNTKLIGTVYLGSGQTYVVTPIKTGIPYHKRCFSMSECITLLDWMFFVETLPENKRGDYKEYIEKCLLKCAT